MLEGIHLGLAGDAPQGLLVATLIEFQDDNVMTIYHDSHDFEVGDRVGIKVYPDEGKNPPRMKRNKGGC